MALHYNIHFYSFVTTIITTALKILECGAGVGPISLNKRSTTKVQGGKGYPTCSTTKEDQLDTSQRALELHSVTRN
jgi:hypothetical protein